jgi:hypothetical protein
MSREPHPLNKSVDALLCAFHRCFYRFERRVAGDGPWVVEGTWDVGTWEEFEKCFPAKPKSEYDEDTGAVRIWGESSNFHEFMAIYLRELLFNNLALRLSDARKVLDVMLLRPYMIS